VNVTVLYIHVCGLSSGLATLPASIGGFNDCSRKFSDSYKAFDPGYPHELVVCCANGPKKNTEMFDGIDCRWEQYIGSGWDIGAEQAMAAKCDSEFIVCMTSRTYFRRAGWLKRFMEEVEKHGDGLYGSTGSYQVSPILHPIIKGRYRNPHIRTAFYGMSPSLFRKYPHTVNSRDGCFMFESGPYSMTNFCLVRGIQCLMVTWRGCYEFRNWRTPSKIFRKGNQRALIAFDHHTDLYDSATPYDKGLLEKLADGWY
jgi:hypothetical protein